MTSGYHGHKTFADGHHEPLTQDEAAALWEAVEVSKAKRAETMPTAEDALRMLISAYERLRELGWALGGGLRVKRGENCAVAQTGSTGMWSGYVDAEGEFVHFGDCVSKPRDAWLKPLAELTEDERVHMTECDRREAEAFSAMLDRLPQQEAS